MSILYFGGFGGYFLIIVMLNRPGRNGRDHYCLLGTGRGWGGGGLPMNNSSSLCSVDPQRPKRPSATTRTINVKTRQCEAELGSGFSVCYGHSFRRRQPLRGTVTRNQLLEPEAKNSPTLSQLLAKLSYKDGPAKMCTLALT